MAKKYNLSSKSDMSKFQRDLKKSVMDNAKSAILKKKFDISCPHCEANITVTVGKSFCPYCRKEIDFQLDFT